MFFKRVSLPTNLRDSIASILHNPSDLDAQIQNTFIPLANWIIQQKNNTKQATFVVGINGAQGSGKTTTTQILTLLLEQEGYRTVGFSIDDFYLPHAERQKLAEIDSRLATRGVPGTHDAKWGVDVLNSLRQGEPTDIPQFDKSAENGSGDRKAEWRTITERKDIVLFEGWCVGAKPLSSQQKNKNDPWQTYWSEALKGDYQLWFTYLDKLIMLKIPDFDTVYANREEQEQRLREALDVNPVEGRRAMTPEEVRKFVDLYKPLTLDMLNNMPRYANLTLEIDENHRVKSFPLS
jgi:D-glycerate 3-kinase